MTSIVIKDLLESNELDQHAMAKVLGGAPREESGLYVNPDKDLWFAVSAPEVLADFMEFNSEQRGETSSGYGAANTANMGAILGSK